VDENLARPVHLAIVDGITTIRGGEGWWNAGVTPIAPGVIVAGFGALSTDAVATAVMGFDARAPHYTAPFETRENHFLIAEQAGMGTADVNRTRCGPPDRRRANALPLLVLPLGAHANARHSRGPDRLSADGPPAPRKRHKILLGVRFLEPAGALGAS
jgi:hypothetical protein